MHAQVSGLPDRIGCLPVPVGFYSSMGSPTPTPCPASGGFRCPGAFADSLHNGSVPIPLTTGSVAMRVPTSLPAVGVRMSIKLEADVSSVDRPQLHTALSYLYQVLVA